MATVGIYALNFDDNTSIYIGQSQDIENRIKRHKKEMQKYSHYNYKVQNAYIKFGLPEAIILEKCINNTQILNLTENFWIDEFDSCRNGLNLRDKDESVLRGPNANSAKYTREQILLVFNMLLDINNTSAYISSISKVPVGNINAIARSASHLWLKAEFPEQYSVLESLKGKRVGIQNTLGSKGTVWPTIVCPDGCSYSNITNLKRFCLDNNIPYDQMHRMCKDKANTVHGWRLVK